MNGEVCTLLSSWRRREWTKACAQLQHTHTHMGMWRCVEKWRCRQHLFPFHSFCLNRIRLRYTHRHTHTHTSMFYSFHWTIEVMSPSFFSSSHHLMLFVSVCIRRVRLVCMFCERINVFSLDNWVCISCYFLHWHAAAQSNLLWTVEKVHLPYNIATATATTEAVAATATASPSNLVRYTQRRLFLMRDALTCLFAVAVFANRSMLLLLLSSATGAGRLMSGGRMPCTGCRWRRMCACRLLSSNK